MKPGDQPQIFEYDHPYGDHVMHVRQTTEIIELFDRCNVRHPTATSWADRNSWKGHQPCARRAGHDGPHQTAQGITWPEGETLGEAIERQGGRSYPRGGYPPPHETDGPHYDWPKASG